MAAWNDKVAVVAGFNSDELDDNVVLRTADGGKTWDTVVIGGKSDHWIKSLCFHNDGRLWMGSSESGLFYSDDMGKNITVLREKLDVVVSIMSIYMTDSVNGFFGTHSNGIYATHDNWRTFERLSTPADQRIKGVRPISIDRIRLWKGNLIVTQNNRVFTSPNVGKSKWRERQISDYEMDAQNDFLWAKSDSGRLVRFADWEHFQRYDVVVEKIIAVVGGNAYCGIPSGVLRVSPDGRTDTCFFLTKDRPVKDTDCWYWMNLPHGNHLWGSDRKSVFLHDSIGWYRIALLDNIKAIKPDPTSSEHIILSLKDGTQRRIDTNGNMEPCRFEKPFDKFVDAGVQSIEIETFSAGCFHYNSDIVRYTRNASEFFEDGDKLKNDNDVFFRPEIRPQPLTDADAEKIEKALKQLGERYDAAPKASDFGLADTTIDVEAILKESNRAASTNHIGYKITIVSNNGDTVRLRGSQSEMNEVACHTRYPWMLPMTVESNEVYFTTYQPCVWQVLYKMMPDTMTGKSFLDNSTLKPHYKPCNGDLLFCKGNSEMDEAIATSTGGYTHVALLERDSNGVLWVIDATPKNGVKRHKFSHWNSGHLYYDVYRLAEPFDTAAVIARAKSLIGLPYDDAFLPDNGKIYCSELIGDAFLDSGGNRIFPNKPMNFRDKRGRVPSYWKKHFSKLGLPIPEKVPGTNPSDLSKSSRLIKVL